MRYLLFVILCISVIPAFAQTDGDTKVVLVNELSGDENYLKAGDVLNDLGYRVRRSDPIFKSIESGVIEFKGEKRGTYKQIMLFAIKDGQVTITSWYKRRGKGKDLATFESGDNVEIAFGNMVKVANSIGGRVRFE